LLCALALCAISLSAPAQTIVLDTGHSLARPGTQSALGHSEYAFNLRLSDAIAQSLALSGIKVIRVGQDGKDIPLTDRTNATTAADLFVSIHHDSIQPQFIQAQRQGEFAGFSIFVSNKNPKPQASLRCALYVGASLVNSGEHPSLYHSDKIPGENRPILDAERGVHRFDDLIVLKHSSSPALLIEAGVIVNPKEDLRLTDPRTALRQGEAIAKGIVGCLKTP
jgi:N-acetylmuramoyl-L-alanine amidase